MTQSSSFHKTAFQVLFSANIHLKLYSFIDDSDFCDFHAVLKTFFTMTLICFSLLPDFSLFNDFVFWLLIILSVLSHCCNKHFSFIIVELFIFAAHTFWSQSLFLTYFIELIVLRYVDLFVIFRKIFFLNAMYVNFFDTYSIKNHNFLCKYFDCVI